MSSLLRTHLTDQNALDLMTDIELTQSLSHVDEAALNGVDTLIGPFSVFQTGIGPDETLLCARDSNHSPAGDSVASQPTRSSKEHHFSFSGPSETSSQHSSAGVESSTPSNIDTNREDDVEEVLSSFEFAEEGKMHRSLVDRRSRHHFTC